MKNTHERTITTWVAGLIAIAFGLMTLKEGGLILFGPPGYAESAGNYVPFVLWFNFTAGFFYILAGIWLLRLKPMAMWLALMITLSTLVVFVLFMLHIQAGGAWERRTLIAMSLRSAIWIGLTLHAFRKLEADSPTRESL